MKKKMIVVVTVISMALLVGCGNKKTNDSQKETEQIKTTIANESSDNNALQNDDQESGTWHDEVEEINVFYGGCMRNV